MKTLSKITWQKRKLKSRIVEGKNLKLITKSNVFMVQQSSFVWIWKSRILYQRWAMWKRFCFFLFCSFVLFFFFFFFFSFGCVCVEVKAAKKWWHHVAKMDRTKTSRDWKVCHFCPLYVTKMDRGRVTKISVHIFCSTMFHKRK